MILGFCIQLILTTAVWVAVGWFQNPYLFIYLLPIGLLGLLDYALLPFFSRASEKRKTPNQAAQT